MARITRLEAAVSRIEDEESLIKREFEERLRAAAERKQAALVRVREARAEDDRKQREQQKHDDLIRVGVLGRFLIRQRDSGNADLYDAVVTAMAPSLKKNRPLFGLTPLNGASSDDGDPEAEEFGSGSGPHEVVVESDGRDHDPPRDANAPSLATA